MCTSNSQMMSWQKLCKNWSLHRLNYNKMNLFILFMLFYISKTFGKPITEANDSILAKIMKNECGFSNDNFLKSLNIANLCNKTIPDMDTLNFDSSPLLCMTYHDINLKYCDLSRNHNLNNSLVNETRLYNSEMVGKLFDKLDSQFKTVNEFCNFTRSRPAFKISKEHSKDDEWSQKFWEHITVEEKCRELCSNFEGNKVKSFCNVLVWAQTLYNNYTSQISNSMTNKSNQKQPPKLPVVAGPTVEASSVNVVEVAKKLYNVGEDEDIKNDEQNKQEVNEPINKGVEAKNNQHERINNNNNNNNDGKVGKQDLDEELNQGGEGEGATKESELSNNPLPQSTFSVSHIMNVAANNVEMEKKKEAAASVQANNDETFEEQGLGPKFEQNVDDPAKPPIEQNEPNRVDSPEEAQEEDDEGPKNEDIEDGIELSKSPTKPIVLENNESEKEAEVKDDVVIHRQLNIKSEESHFYTYFLSMGVVCVIMYLLFHNKKKLVALAVEGRRGRTHSGSRRRPNTASYSKLDSNLEEAMVSNMSQASVTHVLY